jgi:voltage-gated potassium channel
LLVLDLTTELPRSLQLVSYGNWLTVVSLLLPALRVLRIFRAFGLPRAARATCSVCLLRLITR